MFSAKKCLLLSIIFISVVAHSQLQPMDSQLNANDLTIGRHKMASYIATQFMNKISSFTDAEGKNGIFWLKLQFGPQGQVKKIDISTGATASLNSFFLDEMKNVELANQDLLKSTTQLVSIVIPIRFWIHKRGTSETKKIELDDRLLIDFFQCA